MTYVARYYRPSAVVTIGTQVAQDFNLPPPAPRGPRIAFNVRRTMTSEPDTCEISIWNLALERETNMALKHQLTGSTPVTVQAGYGAVVSTLFRGQARRIDPHVRNGPDYALVCTADDGGDVISDLTVSYSTGAFTVTNMIQIAVARINAGDVPAGIEPYPLVPTQSVQTAIAAKSIAASRPYTGVHAGKVRDLLDEAARLLECRWWIADGFLYMAARKLPVDQRTVVLDKRTWLTAPQQEAGGVVRLTSLFDPNIVPGRVVTLVGRTAPGVPEPFRCDAVEIAGDTRSGPWSSAMALRYIGL